MEQVNFYLKSKQRLISQWVMALLFGLLTHNAFAGAISIGGFWSSSGGKSIYNMSNPRYSFILDIAGEVDIRLDNKTNDCHADPYLYLLDSDGKKYDFNDDWNYDRYDIGVSYCETNSRITIRNLPKGEYQLVAATFLPNQSADFVLSASGLGVRNLVLVEPNQLKGIKQPFLKVIDAWQGSAGQKLDNEKNPSYTFKVLKPGTIDIRLENQTNDCQADPYLYLLNEYGEEIDNNDDWAYDPEDQNMTSYCITNSRITKELPKGEYKLVAATYWRDQLGSFVLSLKGETGALSPMTKIRTGYWLDAGTGVADHLSNSNPQFDFRLLEPGLVSIDLISPEADTYLYLLDSNKTLHQIDNGGVHTNSQLKVFLPAGTHSVVATTFYEHQQGRFKLSVTLEGQQGGFYWLKDGSALDSTQVTFIKTDNKPQPIEIQADPSYSAFIKDYIVSDQPQANNMGWNEIDNWWWHWPDNKIGYARSAIFHNFLATSQNKTIYLHLKDSNGHIKSYPLELIYQDRLPISGLSINNHTSYTNNPQVNLQFEVTGDSSIASYLIEEIGSNGQVMNRSGWADYSGAAGTHSISYRLASGDGPRTLRLKLRDKDGYESRFVNSATIFLDTQRPAISLKGNATESIMLGQTYTDAGTTASDNIDGDISKNIILSGSVNTSKLGTYKLTYNVTDAAGNRALQVTRTVIVEPLDTTPPVITLLGDPVVQVDLHTPYIDRGANASDNRDGNISANIQVVNRVDINREGTYKVIYKVTDTAGNSAQLTRTVTVIDNIHDLYTVSGAGVFKVDLLHLKADLDRLNYDLATIYYSTQSFFDLELDNYEANTTGGGGSQTFRPSDKLTSWTISGLKADTDYHVAMVLHVGSKLKLFARSKGEVKVKPPRLNDTGITWGNVYPEGYNDGCTGQTIEQQDCFHGRDYRALRSELKKIGGGVAGFDFTRLDKNGTEYTGSGVYIDKPWACVRDNVTGLVWEVKTTDDGIHDRKNIYRWGGKTAMLTEAARTKWSEALFDDWNQLLDNSNNTVLCGVKDWRLPTAIELFNIANKGAIEPAIDTDYFPNTVSAPYWSSNAHLTLQKALSVNFDNGDINNYFQKESAAYSYPKHRVRLVANTQSTIKYTEEGKEGMLTETPDNRYNSHGNGTVTDKQTGLMWQSCSLGQTWEGNTCTGVVGFYNWQDALAKAQVDDLANYTDWRLPNANELVSLVAFDRAKPAINLTIFPNSPDRYRLEKRNDGKSEMYGHTYWSATTAKAFKYHHTATINGGAWVTDLGNGNTRREYFKLSQKIINAKSWEGHYLNERVYNVRLVRSPISEE